MFSVNHFYDYLRHLILHNKKTPSDLFKIDYDGDKNLNNIVSTFNPHVNQHLRAPIKLCRNFLLLDQEPFNLDYYHLERQTEHPLEYNFDNLNIIDKISIRYSSIYTPILFHSDSNNTIIENLDKHYLIESYHWFHGIISKVWFAQWKFYNVELLDTNKRFGLYARSVDGNRTYRLNLIKDLTQYKECIHFLQQQDVHKELINKGYSDIANAWPINNEIYSSSASASINWDDHHKFKIHIVAETVFDSNKSVHLTEKVFKPMIMSQPFILFANAGSLQYLKRYGFKTFNDLWDESYDDEQDHNKRYMLILNLIRKLCRLPNREFLNLLERASDIVDYNRNHFYSSRFDEILNNELIENFTNSINKQDELFIDNPGGPWFMYVDDYVQKHGYPNRLQKIMKDCFLHLKDINPNVADAALKKYSHLF